MPFYGAFDHRPDVPRRMQRARPGPTEPHRVGRTSMIVY